MEKHGELKELTIGGYKVITDHKHEEFERNEDGSYPAQLQIEITKDGIRTKGIKLIHKK